MKPILLQVQMESGQMQMNPLLCEYDQTTLQYNVHETSMSYSWQNTAVEPSQVLTMLTYLDHSVNALFQAPHCTNTRLHTGTVSLSTFFISISYLFLKLFIQLHSS